MPSSTGFDAGKTAVRHQYLIMRHAMGSTARGQADDRIRLHLEELPDYRDARLVLAYVSFGDEVDTREIIREALLQGRPVAVPRCDTARRTMDFYLIESLEELRPGTRHILEPAADPARLVTPEMGKGSVCLVPGLVFDGEGYRIGYGGGYYDRYLAFYMGEKVGLARSMQVSSNLLPRDVGDVRVDTLVTEAGSFRITLR